MHDQEKCKLADGRDRREIRDDIIGRILAQDRNPQHGGGTCKEQRVAVGCRFRHHLAPNGGLGAGSVFHHHRLAQSLGERLGDDAGLGVRGPSGGKRHDDANGLRGILRSRWNRNEAQSCHGGEDAHRLLHGLLYVHALVLPLRFIASSGYSGLSPAARAASPQTMSCWFRKAPSSPGVEPPGSNPCFSNCPRISGRFRMTFTSRESRSTISFGVFPGANSPDHGTAVRPGIPASAIVGTLGSSALLLGSSVASARSLPSFTNGATRVLGLITNGMRALRRSGMAE